MWSGYRVVQCRCGCQMVEFGDPCSKLITKVALLFSCPGQMPFFAAFDILLELRVHLITQADYGYRSRMRSRQQQTWRSRWQTWTFWWLICCWTTVNCNCTVCLVSELEHRDCVKNGTESTRKYCSGEHGCPMSCTAQQHGDLAGCWTCLGGFCVQQLSF